MIPTLEEFISQSCEKFSMRNSYVRKEGFHTLYVRHGSRYINGIKYNNVFDIANVEVENPRQGTFTKLVSELRSHGFTLFVESILEPRFKITLQNLGFILVENSYPPSYFLKD